MEPKSILIDKADVKAAGWGITSEQFFDVKLFSKNDGSVAK